MPLKPIQPIQKSEAACAIFGAISFNPKGGQPDPISGRLAVHGICTAEAARGGIFGNGVMFATPSRAERSKTLCVWAKEPVLAEEISRKLADSHIQASEFRRVGDGEIYLASTSENYFRLLGGVVNVNAGMPLDSGRIISFGHGMELYKGLESLATLDSTYGLSGMQAHAMIAHTRYPTGSSPKVVRAHPFGFGNVGIVHNGDVTSYSANLAAVESLLGELYHRYTNNGVGEFMSTLHKSWVGTDSEVISAMIYSLLKTGRVSDPSLSLSGMMEAIVPPFDNHLTSLLRGSAERNRLEKRALNYQGFGLDGPVSCLALVSSEDEVHLLAFRDRNDFRPLQIVVDHENHVVYVASELRQITAATGLDVFSTKVESYSPDPGKFLLVSSRSGIIYPGRTQRPWISVPAIPSIDTRRINGAPHQFAGEENNYRRVFYGTLGNHGASYSCGKGTLEIVGSAENNSFEASSLDTVIVHANGAMMVGNAFQGRAFFVRGSLDSRAFSQLRPKDGRAPVAIIGETAGTYLGKMASGGSIMVLGLDNLGKEDVDSQIVGDFLMTGAVGGSAFIRGYVRDESIGRPPSRRDVIAVCFALRDEGVITEATLREIRHNPLNLGRVLKIIRDHQDESITAEQSAQNLETATQRISKLFVDKLQVERRKLAPDEKERLRPYVEEYCSNFGLEQAVEKLLASEYTVVNAQPAESTTQA